MMHITLLLDKASPVSFLHPDRIYFCLHVIPVPVICSVAPLCYQSTFCVSQKRRPSFGVNNFLLSLANRQTGLDIVTQSKKKKKRVLKSLPAKT